ncbi:MAG: AtpZ/AtpI family protein [Fusobacteriaceae bacterium]
MWWLLMKWLDREIMYSFSLLGYLGFILIGNILFFIFIYKIIEKYLFSNTILFIIFLLIGIFSGFYNVYKVIMKR